MTPASSPDPLELLPVTQTARLARRAQRAGRRGPDALEALAAKTDLPPERLRLLADAWNEGGRSGVIALGPAPPYPDEDELRSARDALEQWRLRHPAPDTLRWDLWRNRATLWHAGRAVAHLRLTSGRRWHLYRKHASGEWWPLVVNGRRRPQSLGDCLAALPLPSEPPGPEQQREGYRRPGEVA